MDETHRPAETLEEIDLEQGGDNGYASDMSIASDA